MYEAGHIDGAGRVVVPMMNISDSVILKKIGEVLCRTEECTASNKR